MFPPKKNETWQEKQTRLETEGKYAIVLTAMRNILPELQQLQQQYQKNFIEEIRKEVIDSKWDKKGWSGIFSKKIPEGIQALRDILKNGIIDQNTFIEQAKKIATQRLGMMKVRDSETQKLYEKIRNFRWFKKKEIRDDLARNIRHSGRYGR